MVCKTLILSLFAVGAFARPTEQAVQDEVPKASGLGGFKFPKSGGSGGASPDFASIIAGLKGAGGASGGAMPDFASILGGLKGAGGASGGAMPDFASILGGLKGAGGASGGAAPDFASILGGLKGAGGAAGGADLSGTLPHDPLIIIRF